MEWSTPTSPRPRPPSRGGGRGGGGGRGSLPTVQQHLNPHARPWTPPAPLMRPQDHHQHQHHHHPPSHQHQQHSVLSSTEQLEMIDLAVAKARRDLLVTGESVSSWKVAQAVVLALQVDSWSSLGFSMQQVPSLQSLMAVEGKINSFIHCFVETQTIASLYDLKTAICENEGIERFEELALGPFLRHPLVTQYFSLNSDVTEVFEITRGQIVCYLGKFLSKRKHREGIEIGDLLSFIAKEKSVSEVEKLGVRIQSLGRHISFILYAKTSEATCLRRSLNLSFDDEDDDDLVNEYNKPDDDCNQNEKSGQDMLVHVSVSSQRFERENLTHVEWLKRDMEERDKFLMDRTNFTEEGRKKKGARLVMETSAMRIFMKDWKDACRACSLPMVIEEMLNKYVRKQKRRDEMRTMLLAYPLAFLLNIAVTCIKWGMLEDEYEAIGKQMLNGLIRPTPLPVSKDTQSCLESATDKARHSAEHTKSIILKHAFLSHLCTIGS